MTVREGMPADPAHPLPLRCGDEPVLLDFTGPVRLSCIRICKDPVLVVRRRRTTQLVLSQLLRQRSVKWHPSLRSRRFDSARLSVNIGLAYAYSHAFPIDVTPLQAEYFANPKSHAHCNNAHRSKRFGDVLRYLQELIYRESGRAMARSGLRMMPPFPSLSLKFRKAGFPRSGFKASISPRPFPPLPPSLSPP